MNRQLKLYTISPSGKKLDQLKRALGKSMFESTDIATESNCPNIIVLAGEKTEAQFKKLDEIARSCNFEDGVLIVLLDKTKVPSSLRKIRVFDLSRWRNSERYPIFQELVSALHHSDFEPPTVKPGVYVAQTLKRWCAGITATAIVTGLTLFAFNILSLQNNLCSINFSQPNVSDFCGYFGLGEKPKRIERIAWETISKLSCDALRTHVETFPEGVFHDEAADLLEARRIIQDEIWTPTKRQLALFVGQDGAGQTDQKSAQEQALQRGQAKAERLCSNFANTTLYKLNLSKPEATDWSCSSYPSGIVCGFEGQAICDVEMRQIVASETCGSAG